MFGGRFRCAFYEAHHAVFVIIESYQQFQGFVFGRIKASRIVVNSSLLDQFAFIINKIYLYKLIKNMSKVIL